MKGQKLLFTIVSHKELAKVIRKEINAKLIEENNSHSMEKGPSGGGMISFEVHEREHM